LYLKWQGTKKLTLENREINKIFDLLFEFYSEEKKFKFSLSPANYETRNPYQLLQKTKFQFALSKPNTLNFIDQDTGLIFISHKTEGLGNTIPIENIEYLHDLDQIQKKLNLPMNIPTRPITNVEFDLLIYLRSILHFPVRTSAWIKLESQLKPDGINIVLDMVKNNKNVNLLTRHEEVVELFEQKFPIGMIQRNYSNAKIENIDEIKHKIKNNAIDETIKVVFIPADENSSVTIQYSKWLINP
jgi:hypothetical protein